MFNKKQTEQLNKAIAESVFNTLIYTLEEDVHGTISDLVDEALLGNRKVINAMLNEYIENNKEDLVKELLTRKLKL